MNQTRSFLSLFKGFHSCANLWRGNTTLTSYFYNGDVQSSLWFTNLPSRKKRALTLNDRKRLRKKVLAPSGPLLVDCKRVQFNHYKGMQYSKWDIIPLASKSWHHRQSKGDCFTLLPVSEHPAFLTSPNENLACTFQDLNLSSLITEQMKKLQIDFPTAIQSRSIPHVLRGSSTLITGETGCGKTLAYLAPIIDNVLRLKKRVEGAVRAPFAAVILPTRELALQVGMVAHKLCSELGMSVLILLGGKSKRLLLNPVKEKSDLLVCTPGVLSKLLTHRCLSLELCKHVVLDEADTLLDDSFNEKIRHILLKSKIKFGNLSQDPTKSQLCLVSATMPRSMDSILENIINKDNLVNISSPYLHKIQSHIPQKFMRMSRAKKTEELLKIVKQNVNKKVATMIFCNKTATSNWLSLFLNENGIKAIRINSGMSHESRLEQYQQFRDGLVDIICCTDIASRGLDSTRVEHIVNYEFPRFIADYIHRCGRTGRIGNDKNCLITNFISSAKEISLVQTIEKSVRTHSSLENVNNNITRILRNKSL